MSQSDIVLLAGLLAMFSTPVLSIVQQTRWHASTKQFVAALWSAGIAAGTMATNGELFLDKAHLVHTLLTLASSLAGTWTAHHTFFADVNDKIERASNIGAQ